MTAETGPPRSDDLERARRGDAAAFERLAAAHMAELHAYCYQMLGSVHDADDALQETLVGVRLAAHLNNQVGVHDDEQ